MWRKVNNAKCGGCIAGYFRLAEAVPMTVFSSPSWTKKVILPDEGGSSTAAVITYVPPAVASSMTASIRSSSLSFTM